VQIKTVAQHTHRLLWCCGQIVLGPHYRSSALERL